MRIRGINFDTGFISAGTTTREPFDSQVVKREMQIIHDDLHCNGVRVTGGYPDRLETAATHAAEAGLEVWFCPFTNNLSVEETLALLADCAGRAEGLRKRGAEIVFLTGSELSLMTAGIVPGEDLQDRLTVFAEPARMRTLMPGIRAGMRDVLDKAVTVARSRFGGRLSYAALPFEGVNWGPFDIISTDAGYRTGAMAARFRDDIRAFVDHGRAEGKPVAITEFGCATYRDAGSRGDRDESIVEWDVGGRPVRLKGDLTRDEEEQARNIVESLDVFEEEGVDAAFVYTFARHDLADRGAAHDDLDIASKGVVRVLEGRNGRRYPDLPWEPKAAFDALAERYRAGR
jgi:hypothetical protein